MEVGDVVLYVCGGGAFGGVFGAWGGGVWGGVWGVGVESQILNQVFGL